jgi:hypothetical protein
MHTDISNPYSLSAYTDVDSKNHYLHIRMRIVINRIRIPFIYNIFLINSPKRCHFCN